MILEYFWLQNSKNSQSRFFFLKECSKSKYKSTKNPSELKPPLGVFSKVIALVLSLSFEDFFLMPLISSWNLLLEWQAVLWAIRHGRPMSFTEGIFFWISTIYDLCLLMFTKVLSTPSAIQFAHGMSRFSNAPLTDGIPSVIADLPRHMSKKWVTNLCSSSSNYFAVKGFIFSKFWSLLPSVDKLKG